MLPDRAFVVAAASHPSPEVAVGRFSATMRETSHESGCGDTSWETMWSCGLRLVALHDGEVIGFAALDATACGAPAIRVVVAETWSRRGVDVALSDAVAARAHAVGSSPLEKRAIQRFGLTRS